MKVYISGAITGELNYREKFKRAEDNLHSKGHIVINPSFLPDGLANYMEICKAMIDQCDLVYVIGVYGTSVGTKEEIRYAKSKGINVIYEYDNVLIQ